MEENKIVKIYNEDMLGEYEKEHKCLSYSTIIKRYVGNIILCNNITKVDEYLFDNIIVGEVDLDTEIFQYYIIDNIYEYDIEMLLEFEPNTVIIAYSEVLDKHILMVDHFGTSWDYVLTNVGYEVVK